MKRSKLLDQEIINRLKASGLNRKERRLKLKEMNKDYKDVLKRMNEGEFNA